MRDLLLNDRPHPAWVAIDEEVGPYESTFELHAQNYLIPVTTEEFIGVHLATIREGCIYRPWPTDVVETFLRADVIVDPTDSPLFND